MEGEMPEQQEQQTEQKQEQKASVKWDEWLKGQAPEIVAAYEQHTGGLKTALQSERQQRGELEKQLRDEAKRADKGSDAEKRLTEMADQLNASQRQADFYDEAHTKGVSSLRLAFLAASDAGLIDPKGRTNWDELKKRHPELFGQAPPPPGNAGTGTGSAPGGKLDMNAVIRKAAGH